MIKKHFFFLTILGLLPFTLLGQFELIRNLDLEVLRDGQPLKNAWTGGLNAPQFSMLDADIDGDDDLFVFDRDGNRLLVFENDDNTPGTISYKYDPVLEIPFPEMNNYVLLRDFNCDGKKDIFTNSQSSMKVYKNVSTVEDGLQFELYISQIQAEYDLGGGPQTLPMYCLSSDIPTIADFDNDGDLDIGTFTEGATTMYFYTGRGADEGNCDTLMFDCTNRCYGMFNEATEDNLVYFGEEHTCGFNIVDPRSLGDRTGVHAGGSMLSIDMDANGVLDLILGDVSYNSLLLLMMEDAMDGQDSTTTVYPTFPADINDTPGIDIQKFPAAYYEDLDHDGINDLVAAPNSRFEIDDDAAIRLYRNNGANNLPDFELLETKFLQDQMIDVGRGAYPVAVDVDGDGVKDLVVANKEYYQSLSVQPSQLAVYLNTGTDEDPQLTEWDLNWLNIPQYQLESIYPAFGDLDGDGDMDMILGEELGQLHYFINTAGPGNQMVLELETPAIPDDNGDPIDFGQFTTPQLIDLTGDGLLDLAVGEKNGIVNLLENVGTATDPSFLQFQGAFGDTLGNVLASNTLGINGYSVPHFFRDTNNVLHLLLGNETGTLQHYTNIEGNLAGEFDYVSEAFEGIQMGERSAPLMIDMNNDGALDLFYGIYSGGLIYFQGDVDDSVTELAGLTPEFDLYPNPSNGIVNLVFNQNWPGAQLRVLNIQGQLVMQQRLTGRVNLEIDVSGLPAGMYVVQTLMDGQQFSRRLVVE